MPSGEARGRAQAWQEGQGGAEARGQGPAQRREDLASNLALPSSINHCGLGAEPGGHRAERCQSLYPCEESWRALCWLNTFPRSRLTGPSCHPQGVNGGLFLFTARVSSLLSEL